MKATTSKFNQICRSSWSRNYNDHHVVSTKRFCSLIPSSFVFHHYDSSYATTMHSQEEQPCWDTRSAVVYPNVISEVEETKLVSILTAKFQR
jgi:hypothetical protein